jgi:hypothetical protein
VIVDEEVGVVVVDAEAGVVVVSEEVVSLGVRVGVGVTAVRGVDSVGVENSVNFI